MLRVRTLIPTVAAPLTWPIRWMLDAAELRRLQRQMPGVHRRLLHRASDGIRHETDTEYLQRLRQMARERSSDGDHSDDRSVSDGGTTRALLESQITEQRSQHAVGEAAVGRRSRR